MLTKLTIPKKLKKQHKKEAKTDNETAEEQEEEAPVPLVPHVNTIFHSIISNVEVYINKQQIYNYNGLYAHKSYISNNFNGAMSEYKGVLHCQGYNREEFPDEIMAAPLFETFFTNRLKMFRRPDGFMLYGKVAVDFFSTFELLYPILKIWLRLIRARSIFYMISDNLNVSLGNVACSLIVLLSKVIITKQWSGLHVLWWNSTICRL